MQERTAKEDAAPAPRVWLVLADKQGDNKQVFSLADGMGCAYETRFVYPKPRFVTGKPFFRPSIAHIDPQLLFHAWPVADAVAAALTAVMLIRLLRTSADGAPPADEPSDSADTELF